MNIQLEFENYLIARGYKVQTPKGKPSTVKNYMNSISLICKEENCSWEALPETYSGLLTNIARAD